MVLTRLLVNMRIFKTLEVKLVTLNVIEFECSKSAESYIEDTILLISDGCGFVFP